MVGGMCMKGRNGSMWLRNLSKFSSASRAVGMYKGDANRSWSGSSSSSAGGEEEARRKADPSRVPGTIRDRAFDLHLVLAGGKAATGEGEGAPVPVPQLLACAVAGRLLLGDGVVGRNSSGNSWLKRDLLAILSTSTLAGSPGGSVAAVWFWRRVTMSSNLSSRAAARDPRDRRPFRFRTGMDGTQSLLRRWHLQEVLVVNTDGSWTGQPVP